jgi:hypothetical protein
MRKVSALADTAARLNRDCDCVGTDLVELQRALDDALPSSSTPGGIAGSHPHLFADAPVFIEPEHVRQMQRLIETVEEVVALPAYRTRALKDAPSIAVRDPRAAGVFQGFDFHITPDGPKLIEINTNAGGALLNVAVRDAQVACCPSVSGYLDSQPTQASLEDEIHAMFAAEWRLARGSQPLRVIAIVDDEPERQYLYPEFRLFERLFAERGVRAVIADTRELECVADQLVYRGLPIDLVYNRLTDFYFSAPSHAALKQAYERDCAVITPHPHAHALYANKRNLALLSDAHALREMNVSGPSIDLLISAIPRTLNVDDDAAGWWADRKRWFFKPAEGYGSRGSYRGDKMTRGVFADVMRGGYVAQEFTPPSERSRSVGFGQTAYKIDIRNYVYRGKTQLMAARLYQGQTTNFRTEGGGFAPIYIL